MQIFVGFSFGKREARLCPFTAREHAAPFRLAPLPPHGRAHYLCVREHYLSALIVRSGGIAQLSPRRESAWGCLPGLRPPERTGRRTCSLRPQKHSPLRASAADVASTSGSRQPCVSEAFFPGFRQHRERQAFEDQPCPAKTSD